MQQIGSVPTTSASHTTASLRMGFFIEVVKFYILDWASDFIHPTESMMPNTHTHTHAHTHTHTPHAPFCLSLPCPLQVVCSKCSPYSIPLPKFGYSKPVRICSICYIAHVNNLLHPEATPTTAQWHAHIEHICIHTCIHSTSNGRHVQWDWISSILSV